MIRTRLVLIVIVAALSLPGAPGSSSQAQQGRPEAASANPSLAQGSPERTQSNYSPPPSQREKAIAYSSAHYRHLAIGGLWAMVVPLLILRWRLAARYRDWAERVSSRRFVQALCYAPPLVFTLALMSLPFDLWDHWLERSFGLSVQGWSSWFGDWMTNQIMAVILGTLLIWILYGVIRRSPRRWWFYFWLAAMPVVLAVFFVQPLVIDPLFFKFTPLAATQPVLVAKLEQVVHRGGMQIPPERMFEMNASTKLTGLNAYVTGFGASKRAVIWDTTLAKATTPEVLFVFGHEMGHYVLHHIPKEISIFASLLLGLLYLGYGISVWMIQRYGTNWGIRSVGDWASLPALLFVLTALSVLATPAFNAVSRHFEHEADRYGLEVVHGIVDDQSNVAAAFFEKSGEINLADPDPSTWAKIWFFDHPTRAERVHFAETYDPWVKGSGPKYVK